jgi:hypothetical protein
LTVSFMALSPLDLQFFWQFLMQLTAHEALIAHIVRCIER